MAKAKGTTLIGAVRFLRKNRARALEHLPADLHHYLEDRIHESTWYPEQDLLALVRAMVTLLPGDRSDVLAMMGVQTAREHLEGIYAHLRFNDDASAARRAFALWASQHDTGRFEVNPLGPGEVEMAVSDFGLSSEEMCGIFAGYFEETQRLGGHTNVHAEKRECVLRGDPRCAWRITYDS